jgi:hypothetical protein
MFLIGIPLLVIPFAVYNMVEFLTPGATAGAMWTHQLLSVQMMSGATWTLTVGELLLALSLLILFIELVKASRISTRSLIDHLLSTLLFIGMLVEFLLVKQARDRDVLLAAGDFVRRRDRRLYDHDARRAAQRSGRSG